LLRVECRGLCFLSDRRIT